MPDPAHIRPPHLPRLVERRPWAAACLAALAAVVATHHGISTRSVWLDEAWTVALGAHTAPAILRVAAHDQNPPLYNLLMAVWLHAFGTSEIALRAPSLLAAAATAALLLLFVRRFFGAEAAITATLLYLVSPAQAVYATEGRAYAIVGLLCVASFHLYLSLLEAPRRTTAVVLGGVNAVHVQARVGFREPLGRCIRKRGFERKARALHQREDVIGGAVDHALDHADFFTRK